MKEQLSQNQIGQRVMELRKSKGMSQAELSKEIGISRPSLAQIELGNRGIDAFELYQLANALGFSMDNLMSSGFNEPIDMVQEQQQPDYKFGLRISVPELRASKFKNVLLYILENCAGKPNIGETVLNKLLYFCDFNFYELYEEHLTGARYKKMSFGPVPYAMNNLINQMIEKGQLKRVKAEYHGLSQTRFLPLEKADLLNMSAAEKTVIDHVIQQMSDWNANKISDYSHKDIPWLATKEGDFISYNLAFYRELPYSVRVYEEENRKR
jgi:transcriptional regulator with XRE-family HTH domain